MEGGDRERREGGKWGGWGQREERGQGGEVCDGSCDFYSYL